MENCYITYPLEQGMVAEREEEGETKEKEKEEEEEGRRMGTWLMMA